MTAPFTDPLAGYSPDWRKKLGLPDFSDVGSGSSSTSDPLAGYTPNWRQELPRAQTAQAMFSDLEAPPAADPEVLAGMQETAQEGLDEGPYQRAFNKVGRVARQTLASVPEQAVMGAEALARTGALITRAPISVWGQGGEIQQAAEPAMEEINELAGGAPRGAVETIGRMVGPGPIYGAFKGLAGRAAARAAERAAGQEAMETMGRIHEAPKLGDEAQAYLQEAYQQEPRTPNTQAVVGFQDELNRINAERAAQEAAQRARLEQPRSAIAQAVEDFDRQRYAAQAGARTNPPEMTPPTELTPEVATPEPRAPVVSDLELGDAAELASRVDPTGAPGYLPDPLARAAPAERNPRFGKLSDEEVLARRAEVEARMEKASRTFQDKVQFNTREVDAETGVWSGTSMGKEGVAGRAIHRVRDDARILGDLETEIEARGLKDIARESEGARAEDWLGLDERGAVGRTPEEMERILHPSKGLPEGVSSPEQRASVEKITNEAIDQSAVDEIVGEQTAREGASGGRILGTMAAGGAAGGLAGSQVGDTPEERVRNTFLGAGAGLLGGGILGQARRLGPVARELEELQARRGAAGRKPPPGSLNLFDQEPVQGDLLGERAGELKNSRVGMRPEEPVVEPARETLTENLPGQQGLFDESGAVGVRPEAAPPRQPLKLEPDTPEIDPDDYVNVEKFALDESAEARLRREVTKVVEQQGIHPKQVVTWDETRALANQIGLGDLPKDQINTRLNGPEMLAIRNIVSTNMEALDKLYGRLKTPLDDIEKAKVDRSIGYLEKENDALLGRFTRNRTLTGRDLNNMKILANRVMDPFTWVAKAQNMLESAGKKLTVEQRDRIRELVSSGDKAELVNYMASLRPVSRTGQALSLWKTGLLTNPKTHLANILGNVTMAGLETAKDLPSALVDRMLSLGTGQRAKNFSLLGTARATWKGAKEGTREAMDIIRYGAPADLSRWDIPQNVTFKNPILRVYTQTVTRGLAAPDALFRKIALHRALAEAERLGPLTEESALQAVASAEYAVFQGGGRVAGEQSRLAAIAEAGRKKAGVVGQAVVPFARTPGNVIGATIDYSPFGAIRGTRDVFRLIKAVRAQASPREIQALQRAASEQMGRTITGSSTGFLAGYILARNGLMTGARPSVKKEQDQWDLAGKQENAVKLGGRWWSLNRMAPMGNLMALGANYYLARQEPDAGGVFGGIAAGAASIGTTATEQSFLRGVQELTEAVRDPAGQAEKYLKNQVASVVPAAVGAAARTVDPVVRDTRGGFFDTFKSRIPGVSQSLPAQVDQLGRTKERSGGAVGQFLDPTSSREYKLNDPVIRELERTGAAIQELGQGRPRPAEERKLQAALRNTKSPYTRALLERRLESATGGETREEYLGRARKEGQVLNRVLGKVIQNDRYQALPLEAQKEVLEAAATKVRRQLGQARRR